MKFAIQPSTDREIDFGQTAELMLEQLVHADIKSTIATDYTGMLYAISGAAPIPKERFPLHGV